MRYFVIIGGLAMALLLMHCLPHSRHSGEHSGLSDTLQPVSAGTYYVLVDNWNQFAAESFSSKYRIRDNVAASPEAVVEALNHWIQVYSEPVSPKLETDLAALSEEVPDSSFHAYAAFQRSQRQEPLPRLVPTMPEADLARSLNQLAKVKDSQGSPLGSVTWETARNIVYMNDFCAFFAGEKERLHKRGVDVGINQCSKAGTDGKYLALDALIQRNSPFYNR
jgi:hypothetical protein